MIPVGVLGFFWVAGDSFPFLQEFSRLISSESIAVLSGQLESAQGLGWIRRRAYSLEM